MDDIVKKAMAKWPNVPHCYGWLALDARGAWRMRDERAQHLNLPGDKVIQDALLGFINRNYAVDERGCWYFQNGPQRVFLNLEATPFIARTDPQHGLVLHTGEVIERVDAAWLAETGAFVVETCGKVAQLDDRDAVHMIAMLECNGRPASDEDVMAFLEDEGELTLAYRGLSIAVGKISSGTLESHFRFVRLPERHASAPEQANPTS